MNRLVAAVGLWMITQAASWAAGGDFRRDVLTSNFPEGLQGEHVEVTVRLSARPMIATRGEATSPKIFSATQPLASTALHWPSSENSKVENLATSPIPEPKTQSVILYAVGALAVLLALKRTAPRR